VLEAHSMRPGDSGLSNDREAPEIAPPRGNAFVLTCSFSPVPMQHSSRRAHGRYPNCQGVDGQLIGVSLGYIFFEPGCILPYWVRCLSVRLVFCFVTFDRRSAFVHWVRSPKSHVWLLVQLFLPPFFRVMIYTVPSLGLDLNVFFCPP